MKLLASAIRDVTNPTTRTGKVDHGEHSRGNRASLESNGARASHRTKVGSDGLELGFMLREYYRTGRLD